MLDIRLLEVGGYAVCAQLKSNAATQHIPISFLSALGNDRIAAFKNGGADPITKSFQPAADAALPPKPQIATAITPN